jgi:hypothetical protein
VAIDGMEGRMKLLKLLHHLHGVLGYPAVAVGAMRTTTVIVIIVVGVTMSGFEIRC